MFSASREFIELQSVRLYSLSPEPGDQELQRILVACDRDGRPAHGSAWAGPPPSATPASPGRSPRDIRSSRILTGRRGAWSEAALALQDRQLPLGTVQRDPEMADHLLDMAELDLGILLPVFPKGKRGEGPPPPHHAPLVGALSLRPAGSASVEHVPNRSDRDTPVAGHAGLCRDGELRVERVVRGAELLLALDGDETLRLGALLTDGV